MRRRSRREVRAMLTVLLTCLVAEFLLVLLVQNLVNNVIGDFRLPLALDALWTSNRTIDPVVVGTANSSTSRGPSSKSSYPSPIPSSKPPSSFPFPVSASVQISVNSSLLPVPPVPLSGSALVSPLLTGISSKTDLVAIVACSHPSEPLHDVPDDPTEMYVRAAVPPLVRRTL